MKQISIKNLEAAVKKIDTLNEAALDKLIETYTLKQQALVDYILQAGMEFQNEDLNVYAIYYFAVVSEAMHQQGLALKTITEDDIDEFHEPFLMALDSIRGAEDHEPLQDLVQQPIVQQFLVDDIESPDADGKELDEETKTQLFIVTMSMLGIMNAAVSASA